MILSSRKLCRSIFRSYLLFATLLLLLLLLVAHHARAQTSHSSIEPQQQSAPQAPSITANPNPVAAGSGKGTTYISWTTGDKSPGRMHVAGIHPWGGESEERLCGIGTQSVTEVTWITPDSVSEFRLYSDTEPRKLLASVRVIGTSEVAPVKFSVESALSLLALLATKWGAAACCAALLFAAGCYLLRKGGSSRHTANVCFSVVAVFTTLLVILSITFVKPIPLAEQSTSDSQDVADAARQLAIGNGYVTYNYDNKPQPLIAPPGMSVALWPFAAIGTKYPSNIQTGVKVYVALYVVFAVASAWIIGGPIAAALIAAFIGVSPFVRKSAALVLSDALAAGVTALLIGLVYRPSRWRIAVAGILAGALVPVKLPMVINLAALFIVLPNKWRTWLVGGSALPLAAYGLFNWANFGRPWRTGYGHALPGHKFFDWSYPFVLLNHRDGPFIVADLLDGLLLRWICPCTVGGSQASMPNLTFYPAVLLGLFWVFAPPLITFFGMIYVWKQRQEIEARFTFLVVIFSLMLFGFYFAQGTRFMAAPATLLLICAAIYLTCLIKRYLTLPHLVELEESNLIGSPK